MDLVKIDDIATILSESDYVIQNVATRFTLFVPSTRIGNERFYPPEAVGVFRLIVDQLQAGVRDEYVEIMLQKRFPITEVSVAGVSRSSSYRPALRVGRVDQRELPLDAMAGTEGLDRVALPSSLALHQQPARSAWSFESESEQQTPSAQPVAGTDERRAEQQEWQKALRSLSAHLVDIHHRLDGLERRDPAAAPIHVPEDEQQTNEPPGPTVETAAEPPSGVLRNLAGRSPTRLGKTSTSG